MTQLVLSLFPGIGLLDMAFEAEGFCVVRGPDVLWGGDVRSFRPPAGRFDGVIGGPPCQAFSRLRHLVEANGYQTAPNLIPEFERVVAEARPRWWLMENVPAAPVPEGARGHGLVRDVDCGGLTSRLRRFSWGGLDLDWHLPQPSGLKGEPAVMAGSSRSVPVAMLSNGELKRTKRTEQPRSLEDVLRLQGLPADFLDGAPFTQTAKQRAIGNGVPLPMGRALARAVRLALEARESAA